MMLVKLDLRTVRLNIQEPSVFWVMPHLSCELNKFHNFNGLIPVAGRSKGTRVLQADSGSDSDSKSRNENEEIIPVNHLTPTVCTDPPEPATTIRTCALKQRTFFAPVGAKN